MPDALPFDRTRVIPFRPGSYQQVLRLQHRLVQQRADGQTPDVLLVGEHERVVTLGRGTRELPPDLPIPVQEVERGGEATWHGPGQLVVYPILRLKDLGLGVRQYLRGLEAALIQVLAVFGLEARREEGATGVWVGEQKIASLGVAVRRGVSYHGLALNVDPDLSDFQLIRPCGFAPDVMTSVAALVGAPPERAAVDQAVVQALVRELGLAPPIWEEPAPLTQG